jgi:hypothetical protein
VRVPVGKERVSENVAASLDGDLLLLPGGGVRFSLRGCGWQRDGAAHEQHLTIGAALQAVEVRDDANDLQDIVGWYTGALSHRVQSGQHGSTEAPLRDRLHLSKNRQKLLEARTSLNGQVDLVRRRHLVVLPF